MNINIKVNLHAKGNNFLQSGSFPVANTEFKKDPDWTAAIAAYEWIQQIQNEYGSSQDFRIDQVVYNDDIDITELVKKVTPIIQDDLPF
ncbi:hypothetical protein ACFCVU_13735 [Peribacillus butanolivorans]|uniref:hypothetical protein n=1 Tax=Peribacillus butanolivorans TaxID=421767 RepID=UPI0035D5504D